VQGHRETPPHPPPRPWPPRCHGERTPHACPCHTALPRQALRPGTVPLLQGWPGSRHARLCDAFRPACLLLPHAVCVCARPLGSRRGPAASRPAAIYSPSSRPKAILSRLLSGGAGGRHPVLLPPLPLCPVGLALLFLLSSASREPGSVPHLCWGDS